MRRGATSASRCDGPQRSCALQRGALVVELEHAYGAIGGGVEAQAAEHALVEVLLDEDRVAAFDGIDVDGADLREPGRDGGVLGDGVVDLHADEGGLGPHAAALLSASLAFMISGIWEISSATVIPASARRAIFSLAVSSLPSTIVPAWPKLMPGISSMNRPAMKATIGRRESFSVTQRASSASMRPPGSV